MIYTKFQCRLGYTEDVRWYFALAGCFAYILCNHIIPREILLVGLLLQFVRYFRYWLVK